MFTRVKESRRNGYLQIVENYRDGDRVRQLLVLYVGRYDSIDDALHRMPRDLRTWRARRTRITRIPGHEEFARKEVEDLNYLIEGTDRRLQALRALAKEHPELLERDRKRAARRPGQVAARNRARRAQRELERRGSAERSDQHQQTEG
jgi:hypothetical protein